MEGHRRASSHYKGWLRGVGLHVDTTAYFLVLFRGDLLQCAVDLIILTCITEQYSCCLFCTALCMHRVM